MRTDREYIELLEQYSKQHFSQEELQELLQWLDSESGEEAYNSYLGSCLEEACKAETDCPDKLARKILRRVKKQAGIKDCVVEVGCGGIADTCKRWSRLLGACRQVLSEDGG